MPYDNRGELPDAVKALPAHGQEIYLSVFNNAWEQYKNRGNQQEPLAHATAWAAVKKQYEKVGDKWVAKEAGMANKMSAESKKKLLQSALVTEYGLGVSSPKPKDMHIVEMFDGEIIYDIDGQSYRASYTFDEAGEPTIGEPEKVLSKTTYTVMESAITERMKSRNPSFQSSSARIKKLSDTEVDFDFGGKSFSANYLKENGKITLIEPVNAIGTDWKPMEALKDVYTEILQEAGRRNASLDSARLKRIVALCQELLSSEDEPDEKKATEALREATEGLAWLKLQEAMKTEDGQQYPASAFAYAPSVETPSGWKLRMWEDSEKKITRAQLGRAAAALSPGGFRGQKVAIPAADLSAVKRKIRAAYRGLDVADEDIPKWVKETETRELVSNYTPLTEAKFDKGRATVIVIKAGFNASEDRYYPADMLKRDYKVFEGQKMYADHPTSEEDKARPERSIKDWVATLTNVTVDESGTVTGVASVIEPWLMEKLAHLRDQKMLAEMGISINAVGSASKGTVEGRETLVIEKLVAARSVDFVTEPGAGGVVTFYEADRSHDVDLVELSGLKERRPDLVKALEAEVREGITKEARKAMELEKQIEELQGQLTTLTTERDSLKEAAEKAVKAQAIAEAQATIKEAVDKAELPGAAKERLLERFADAESADGIVEAIKSEVDYIAKLSESGKVRGMGATQPNAEKGKQALKESFMRGGMSEKDADVAVGR